MEKGFHLGMQKGIRQAAGMLIKRQLSKRFGQVPGWVEEHLDKADSEKLKIRADCILDAKSLEEVFL